MENKKGIAGEVHDQTPEPDVKQIIAGLVARADELREKKQYSEALLLYEEAGNMGDAHAQLWAGNFHDRALGTKVDVNKAFAWYKKAADQNDSDAINNLGFMYEEGRGVMKDECRAMELYRQAAAMDNPTAIKNLGNCYLNEKGPELHYAKAKKLFEKAVSLGHSPAKESLKILRGNIRTSIGFSVAAFVFFLVASFFKLGLVSIFVGLIGLAGLVFFLPAPVSAMLPAGKDPAKDTKPIKNKGNRRTIIAVVLIVIFIVMNSCWGTIVDPANTPSRSSKRTCAACGTSRDSSSIARTGLCSSCNRSRQVAVDALEMMGVR